MQRGSAQEPGAGGLGGPRGEGVVGHPGRRGGVLQEGEGADPQTHHLILRECAGRST